MLLHHFGLTARDVLPLGYPKFSVTDLRREGAGVDRDVSHPLDEEAESVLAAATSLAGGRVSLRYLLGALLVEEVSLRWRGSLAARGADVIAVRRSYDRWLRAERQGGVNGNRKLISCRQVKFDQFRVHSESAVSAGTRPRSRFLSR